MAMSVGTGGEEEGSAISEINTTPLVDIMLVLLIIFLITVPVVRDMARVEIPKAVNIPTQTKPENITISVDRSGTVFWNASRMQDRQVFFQRIVAEARKVRSPSSTFAATRKRAGKVSARSFSTCNAVAS
jgi:biopolymer transport protein ExbD